MITFLLLLRTYWRAIAIVMVFIGTFYAGWHIRGVSDDLKVYKQNEATAKADNKVADTFEKAQAKIQANFDNLDLKPTYESSYSCLIPANGLRLIAEATK